MKLHLLMLKTLAALLALTSIATAQDYPSKPVRVIIPFPPGGVNDTVGRLVATQLSTRLGKQFIVDNRGGAGGTVGTELAANAPKDGYTLLVVSLAHTVNPWLYKLPYDPIKAFAPIAIVASAPNVIVVHPSLPVHSVKELVDMAKQQPGKLQYASAGVGSFMHLGGELFKLAAGVDLLHVPFRGNGPAMTAVLGGQVQAAFADMISSVEAVRAGKLRGLAVTTTTRSPALPDLPTIAEAGVPGYEASSWFGLGAPKGTPPEIVERLNREINAGLTDAQVRTRLANVGGTVIPGTPADFRKVVTDETEKWGGVVRAANIKAE
jgi:tripartite-type tricarboxylate transporter receptor subunit TctC